MAKFTKPQKDRILSGRNLEHVIPLVNFTLQEKLGIEDSYCTYENENPDKFASKPVLFLNMKNIDLPKECESWGQASNVALRMQPAHSTWQWEKINLDAPVFRPPPLPERSRINLRRACETLSLSLSNIRDACNDGQHDYLVRRAKSCEDMVKMLMEAIEYGHMRVPEPRSHILPSAVGMLFGGAHPEHILQFSEIEQDTPNIRHKTAEARDTIEKTLKKYRSELTKAMHYAVYRYAERGLGQSPVLI